MLLSTPPNRIHEIETRYPALLHKHPTSNVISVFLNTHEPPFDDVRVRRALNYAIDRSRMIVSIGGRPEQVTCQLFPPNFPGYVPYCPYTRGPQDGTWHGPDLKRARHLVAASGTAGMRVTVVIPKSFRSFGDGGAVVVAALRQLGYDARQTVIDTARYHELTERHRTRVQVGHVYSFGLDYPAASGELNPIYRCLPGVDDQFGYRDATTCATIRRARTLAAQGLERQANAAWAQVDRQLVNRAPFVAYAVIETSLIVSSRVRNYHYSPILGVLVGQAQVR
jgi:peptide/nickel transport system substrate-binding protein